MVHSSPRLRFGGVAVRGRGVRRAFDAVFAPFSREQTFLPSVATTHRLWTQESPLRWKPDGFLNPLQRLRLLT